MMDAKLVEVYQGAYEKFAAVKQQVVRGGPRHGVMSSSRWLGRAQAWADVGHTASVP